MRILLLGDASNYHNSLAAGLRRLGHDVTVASAGSGWMQTARDIDLSRGKGRISGALLWLKLKTVMASQLKRYDVVQLCSPFFIDLKPTRLRGLLDDIRRHNGAVFLTDLGNTPHYAAMCSRSDSPLRYSEWSHPGATEKSGLKDWLDPRLDDYCRHVFEEVDGVMTALYEYHVADSEILPQEKIHYTGIPIDLQSLPKTNSTPIDRVCILSAFDATRADHKGAGALFAMAMRVAAFCPNVELRKVNNVPYKQFLNELASSDIVLDQLFSYTPATTALLTMAMGRIPVSGGEEDFYRFIDEPHLRPIINADPLDLNRAEAMLRAVVSDRELRQAMSEQGRRFVECHNSADVVARRFEKVYLGA